MIKVSNLFAATVILFFGASLFLTGCSDPQKQARQNLEKKGYELTLKDLLVAASAGDVESITLFNEAGVEIDGADRAGNTALIKAAGAGHLAAVEKILGLGADPRQFNAVGRDALISSSAKGYEEVARMLLNRGADSTLKDTEGWGALSIAAYNGHAGVVSLLSANATPAELDDALLVSSFSGNAKVISTLLGQGANINARSPENKTPLMIASEVGKIAAVRILLQNQANPFAVDLNNQTAANLAQVAGFEEVTKLITDPASWGTSKEGLEVAVEMAKAQEALGGAGVEETLVQTPKEKKAASSTEAGGTTATTEIPRATPVDPLTVASAAPIAATQNKELAGARAGDLSPRLSAPKPAPAVASAGAPAVAPPLVAVPVRAAPSAGGTIAMVPAKTAAADILSTGVPLTPPVARTTAVSAADSPATDPVVVSKQRSQGVVSRSHASGNPPASRPTVAANRQLREQSKSKPIVALNGSTIHSRTPEVAPVKAMVLAAYHEESLPIIVDHVNGRTASVRRLDQPSAGTVDVEEGSLIPGTHYRVQEVTTRYVSSKEGKGRMVDVSRVKVEDTQKGSTHLLVKDVSGQTADTYAILTAPNSQYRYVVKAGDVFRTTQPDRGTIEYQVLDIRPTGVVIKDLATDEVVTVARDGVLAP